MAALGAERAVRTLRDAKPTALTDGILTLSFRGQLQYSQVANSAERKQTVVDAIARVVGVAVTIRCELGGPEGNAHPAAADQPPLIQDIMDTFPGSTLEDQ